MTVDNYTKLVNYLNLLRDINSNGIGSWIWKQDYIGI